MPRLSDSMEEGTILRWLKASGEEVKRGEELAEIETDKANMTYESDQDGVLEIVAHEGDTLAIGALIARIGERGGGNGAPPVEAEAEAEGAGRREEVKVPRQPLAALVPREPDARVGVDPAPRAPRAPRAPGGNGTGRVKASPVARRVARELGVDLRAVEGSGPGGRIVKADVEGFDGGHREAPTERVAAPAPSGDSGAAAPAPAVSGDSGGGKGEVRVQELTRSQQVVARRMAESKATVPEFTLQAEVDMSAAVVARAQLKASVGARPVPSYNDMIVKACALALRAFPRANGAYRDGRWELYSRVNVGIAVAAEGALVVPTIFDADRRSLGEIARSARTLAERVRAGAITPPELSNGTFTVSNLGMYGVTSFTAVINPPQAAILAVGAVRRTPVVRDGEVVPGHVMSMTLVSDHRILYGADAAEFLARVRALLAQPFGLAL